MQNLIKMGCGRKKESSIWTHFSYDAVLNISKCTVIKEDGVLCGKEYSGKYPTNLKAHLAKHESVYKKCQADDESLRYEKRKASSTSSSCDYEE
jgi:hypothetical protein